MLSLITPTLTGEPRLAAFFTLVLASAVTQALAQSTCPHAPTSYGGQLVQEMVPFQPQVLYAAPPLDQTPLYLDTCPEFCLPTEAVVQPSAPTRPADSRDGLFQKLFFSGTWIPQLADDSLGITELETGILFGLPFFKKSTPLLISPRFAVHYLDGPTTPDLPARVYDAETTFRHLRKFRNGPWAMDAAITLGHYSDLKHSDADAFRVSGHALAVYETTPDRQWPDRQWIVGVAYLNRRDISFLPVIGVIHKPTPNIKYEAILSRPRFAWRLPDGERWAYLAGEFGGGIWSIWQSTTLKQDLLSYNDYRILLGIERRIAGTLNHRLEVGYVFGREIKLVSSAAKMRLDDSLFVRGGVSF